MSKALTEVCEKLRPDNNGGLPRMQRNWARDESDAALDVAKDQRARMMKSMREATEDGRAQVPWTKGRRAAEDAFLTYLLASVILNAQAREEIAARVAALELHKGRAEEDLDELRGASAVYAELAARVAELELEKGRAAEDLQQLSAANLVLQARLEEFEVRMAQQSSTELRSAHIDRGGQLILVKGNGDTIGAGSVVGRDAFEVNDIELFCEDGGRQISLRFMRGHEVGAVRTIQTAVVLDRGAWQPGRFQPGDGTTWKGSFWIAQRETIARPDAPGSDWRLAVKKGRDGKDVVSPVGRPAIDATQ
jgi:hypothetical protein